MKYIFYNKFWSSTLCCVGAIGIDTFVDGEIFAIISRYKGQGSSKNTVESTASKRFNLYKILKHRFYLWSHCSYTDKAWGFTAWVCAILMDIWIRTPDDRFDGFSATQFVVF